MLSRKKNQARLSRTDEAQLVHRLRDGDRSAQAEVVQRYRQMLLRQAFAVVRRWPLAEDVVQDAWILAFKNIGRFEGRSALRSWLVGIVINQARRYRRQERRFPVLSAILRGPDETAPSSPSTATPLPEVVTDFSAEQMLLERERGHALKAAVRRLPVTQRSVLVLQLEGYSPAETRTTLRISEVARRVRLSRARARLRRAFRWDSRSCA
jgi:RNA polymerase sigma-70 factor, ECF subfamily